MTTGLINDINSNSQEDLSLNVKRRSSQIFESDLLMNTDFEEI